MIEWWCMHAQDHHPIIATVSILWEASYIFLAGRIISFSFEEWLLNYTVSGCTSGAVFKQFFNVYNYIHIYGTQIDRSDESILSLSTMWYFDQ